MTGRLKAGPTYFIPVLASDFSVAQVDERQLRRWRISEARPWRAHCYACLHSDVSSCHSRAREFLCGRRTVSRHLASRLAGLAEPRDLVRHARSPDDVAVRGRAVVAPLFDLRCPDQRLGNRREPGASTSAEEPCTIRDRCETVASGLCRKALPPALRLRSGQPRATSRGERGSHIGLIQRRCIEIGPAHLISSRSTIVKADPGWATSGKLTLTVGRYRHHGQW
jgi:hypothetical protein